MSTTSDSLLGKKVEILVGEPWNFSSSAGENVLKGEVQLVTNFQNRPVVLLSVSPFQHNGVEINEIIGISRYKGVRDLLGEASSRRGFDMTFHFWKTGEKIHDAQVPNIFNDRERASGLIGVLRLVDNK